MANLRLGVCVLALSWLLPAAAIAQDRAAALSSVKTWAYQLKDVTQDKVDKVAASPFDMVIIDSSMFPDGREVRLTRAQIDSMKKKPDGSRRQVIAYFSAGECEDFRYYWKPEWNKNRPSWVSKADKQWKGDYVVKYWQPEWQKIVYGTPNSLIDRILDAGFDGLSIDRVDAYYYFGDTEERRQQMVDLVKKMTNYIRERKPDALILAQNAEELVDHKRLSQRHRRDRQRRSDLRHQPHGKNQSAGRYRAFDQAAGQGKGRWQAYLCRRISRQQGQHRARPQSHERA